MLILGMFKHGPAGRKVCAFPGSKQFAANMSVVPIDKQTRLTMRLSQELYCESDTEDTFNTKCQQMHLGQS